jgi:hypothetical protein
VSGYIDYPIDSDPTDLLNEAYATLKSKVPTWVENDNNLDTWILQIVATEAAGFMSLSQDVPDSIFKWFGSKLMGLAPLDATPAIVGSTWTMQDTAGYTIPAGTQVSIRDSVGVEHAFITTVDTSIPAGSSATAAGGITLTSVETGSALSNLGGSGYVATLIDTLAYVQSVVLTGATAGGQDAELSSDYNNRLARKLQRLSQRPVLGSDFTLAALDVTGVYRSVALDGYNPGDGTMNNQRMIGIAAVDQNGTPISATIKTNLLNYLQSLRETNFIVNVFDPTVTQIDVTFNVKCIVSFTAATVQANAVAKLQDYLNAANWGTDPSITDATAAAQTWVETTTVYYNKIMAELALADGVDRVISMTMAIHSAALGTADIVLPGHGCLAASGTINGTATP